MTLSRYSERWPATGGQAAVGLLSSLGRPDMEPLEVLVREAVQNSWDAHSGRAETVDVLVGYRRLTSEQRATLVSDVLVDPPPGLPLGAHLEDDAVDVLYFADYGTKGLGGHTRADVSLNEPPKDYVDFVLKIGEPPDTEFGGGSYGFGKAAFYIISHANTVIIDTLTTHEDERRLIAYGLGDGFEDAGGPHTGRHWWGDVRGGFPEPVKDDAAADLASRLGLPARASADGHGTTVAIVLPRLAFRDDDDDTRREPKDAMRFISDCLLWNFWPKMVPQPGAEPAMRFSVQSDGIDIEVADPRRHRRLTPFTDALVALRDRNPPDNPFLELADARCLKPRRRVGRLAVLHTATDEATTDGPVPEGAQMTAAGHRHVALMRKAELVVKYLAGPPLAVPGRGYAGAFKCDEELDETFRASEPPTHDDWQPDLLPDWAERRLVSSAQKRIYELLDDLARPSGSSQSPHGAAAVPLGRLADQLGQLMPGISGSGARRSVPLAAPTTPTPGGGDVGPGGGGDAGPGDTGGGGTPATPRPPEVRVSRPRLVMTDDGIEIQVDAELAEPLEQSFVMRGSAQVLTLDGTEVEDSPPEGASVPRILGWRTPDGGLIEEESVTVQAGEKGVWVVRGSHVAEVLTRLGIETGWAEP